MKKGETFVYLHEGNAYINLTNRCCNDCAFCLRRSGDGIEGNVLWLTREPEAGEVIERLKALKDSFSDVVFCGYGEPAYRLNELASVAEYAHSINKKTRLNTNGLGNAIHGFNIVSVLKGKIDAVSVSLNESSPERYNEICRPSFGLDAYGYILEFTKKCAEAGIETALSVVDVIPEPEIEKCRETAKHIGATFRLRKKIDDNERYA